MARLAGLRLTLVACVALPPPAIHGSPAPPPHSPPPCGSAADCGRLGTCSGGRCVCGRGWTGDRCEQLDLAPVEEGRGLQPLLAQERTSSWGGAIAARPAGGGPGLRRDAGAAEGPTVYHMVYSELERHCGINAWLSNSVVKHATATDPTARPRTPPPASGTCCPR